MKCVKEKHGVVPGDKSRFIGLWKTELTAMVNDLKNNLMNKKELQKWRISKLDGQKRGPHPINENGEQSYLPIGFVVKCSTHSGREEGHGNGQKLCS